MTSPIASSATVSNTSCLIALEAVGRVNLLQQLYGSLLVPPAVASEWGTTCPSWITIQTVQNHSLAQALHLQLGEAKPKQLPWPSKLALRV